MHPEFITKDGKREYAILPYEEFVRVEAALARLAEKELADPCFGSFRDNLSAEEHARRQGVGVVEDWSSRQWPYSPEDWEGFDEAVESWRQGDPL